MMNTNKVKKLMEKVGAKQSSVSNFTRLMSITTDCFNELIGGYENTLLDYQPNDEEYKEAMEFLTDKEDMINTIISDIKYELERPYNKKN